MIVHILGTIKVYVYGNIKWGNEVYSVGDQVVFCIVIRIVG